MHKQYFTCKYKHLILKKKTYNLPFASPNTSKSDFPAYYQDRNTPKCGGRLS